MADELLDAWDDIDPGLPVAERMAKLEAMMRAFRDSEAAATYLKDSVERLGLNAIALSNALEQVDKNQQALSKLGQQLTEVDQQKVDKTEVDRRARELAQFTKVSRRNLGLQMLAGLAFLACTILYVNHSLTQFQHDSYDVCQDRAAQSQAFETYLTDAVEEAYKKPGLTAKERALIDKQVAQLEKVFPPVDCKRLKP